MSKSQLKKYFKNNDKRLIHKWNHYFDIYERHFSRFKNRPIVLLEIGVFHGGSLQMWKDYFGESVQVYGVDINPECKKLEEDQVEIHIGSQTDRSFLRQLKKKIPPVDILIDDGGHIMKQQKVTFEELFDHVKEDGIYLCEDTHSSYMYEYGGGYRRRGTFIEFSKRFIDYIHAFHSQQRSLKPDSFTKSVDSVHYYDSIVVIEKQKRQPPFDEQTGIESYKSTYQNSPPKYKALIKKVIGKTLQVLRVGSFR
ncbi:class I SAM-dependent methyltransferase [Roseivirga sp. E12]|uniref:class I SAM-dependent methyltransferase n=1 Tax=Roseivirga sp. E12 TaxID=2819237 RepID=UPI001ABC0C72|nr:class I SAM-dependent methyltransferase [Roseivirga sp. E12]MBO3699737.1 class I SAM-dependent methyltransferase [Roseivirga sp. E12]